METLKTLLDALAAYDQAARKFIRKCETGRAKSVETVADLRKCLLESAKAKEQVQRFFLGLFLD